MLTMMNPRRPALNERQLRRWADDLRGREEALAREQAAFERRAERFTDAAVDTLEEALAVVAKAFPAGLVFAPHQSVAAHSIH
jgi:hypothetical protein